MIGLSTNYFNKSANGSSTAALTEVVLSGFFVVTTGCDEVGFDADSEKINERY